MRSNAEVILAEMCRSLLISEMLMRLQRGQDFTSAFFINLYRIKISLFTFFYQGFLPSFEIWKNKSNSKSELHFASSLNVWAE